VAFLFLPNLFFQSLQHLATLSTQAIASVAGAERVFQLIDEQPVWKDAPEAVALPRTGAVHSAARSGARVVFRNVSFGYGPARPVLCDVSFSVEPGQTVALVGPTGSGKTTLVSLLAKLYPVSSGRIEIDGHDIAGLTGSSIRAQMGIVPQANFLFSGTVMDNVRFGCPSASDEEIRAAARRLDCLDLVEAMPQGFLTEVGERGGALSLGQRQLVCFLRALLAEPRLLILDEATSSVDTITEARLQRALERLLESRTSFVVAHRLSTIRRADLILVLDRGAIVDRGSHLELLARPGLYRSLYQQFALSDLS
jgi:ATP-binding cassette subfamily B protein